MSIRYEQKMIRAMIRLYCRKHHDTDGQTVCADCAQLQDYANSRLANCPFGDDKSSCRQCAIHCYKPAIREEMTKVMRYAGPRMLYRHPIMAMNHLRKEIFGKRPVLKSQQ
ncbi:MAG TPA: nitrous oxide-stimulated promoter family protein [Phycisphaerales bacterium]|nr:nitrous oxide-stimulated promoter family protein [Phycisphaerales bacterium]HCD33776.1 nitrous oxide-stimulated promoter family protein [Phycisphaerales bacterium]